MEHSAVTDRAVAALGIAFLTVWLPSVFAATCPPLLSSTVEVVCILDGRSVNCSQPVALGTKATFRCKPLHQFLFGYLPATGYESLCQPPGEWSVQPFRCVPICGRPTGMPKAFVRDGEVVSSSADYPWHVTVYLQVKKKGPKKQICGGSLVTVKYFVSAAHCFHNNVEPQPPINYLAAFAKIYRSADVVEPNMQFRDVIVLTACGVSFKNGFFDYMFGTWNQQIAQIHMKDYGARKLQYTNDIALVELTDEVEVSATTLPVCMDWGLEQPDLRHGENGKVVGFGNTNLETNEVLRFAKLPFIDSEECKRRVSDKLAIFSVLPDKFCVGFYNNTSVGPGDSGGGLFVPDDERVWYLRGVVSVGLSDAASYSYFTNVTAFVPWISGIIRKGEMTGRRCGVDVSMSEVLDGTKAEHQNFPWELDIYLKKSSARPFERLWSGVLVQPNLVISARSRFSLVESFIDLGKFPVSWLRVATRGYGDTWDQLDKASNVSEVVQVIFPANLPNQADHPKVTFILLELKKHLNLMPVCLDWTGAALLQNFNTVTTLVEKPKMGGIRFWKRYPLINAEKCKPIMRFQVAKKSICTFQSVTPDILPAARVILVNVDNTWFLRGVWSSSYPHGNGSTSEYTDMADAGVQQWLSENRDLLGKPTCGDIKLCKPLTQGLSMPGHLPWTVALVHIKPGGRIVTMGSGVLVQPNVVITDSTLVIDHAAWDRKSEETPPTLPTTTLAIQWTNSEGKIRKSSVVRVYLYRRQIFDDRTNVAHYDMALLELDSAQPVSSTPVCLDLNGINLKNTPTGQLGLAESWFTFEDVSGSNHSLVALQIGSNAECNALAAKFNNVDFRGQSQLCTPTVKGAIDGKAIGGGYLVNSGLRWFLKGIFTNVAKLRRSPVVMAVGTDFSNPDLRAWLRKKISKLPHVQSGLADNLWLNNCEGGRPDDKQCGIFVPREDASDSEDLEDDEHYLKSQSHNHMEWNVYVKVVNNYVRDGQWLRHDGTLVSRSLVVTDASWLVKSSKTKIASSVETIPASDAIIEYYPTEFVGHTAEVRHIYVRERSSNNLDDSRYDLALLELKTSIAVMPICVPVPGLLGRKPSVLSKGSIGLVETFNYGKAENVLVPMKFTPSDECKTHLPAVTSAHFSGDRFCADRLSTDVEPRYGASFAVPTEGVWYIRGVNIIVWRVVDSAKTPANFTIQSYANLDDPDVLAWLASRINSGGADGLLVTNVTTLATASPSSSTTTSTLTSNSTAALPTLHTTIPDTTTTPIPTINLTITTQRSRPAAILPVPPKPEKRTQCGWTSLPLDAIPANDSLRGHLPWSVVIMQLRTDGSADPRRTSGVLVRPDLVLSVSTLFQEPREEWEDKGTVLITYLNKLRVVWLPASGAGRHSEVLEIYVHKRRDLALLRLKTPLQSIAACFHLGPHTKLAPSSIGVVESWDGDLLVGDHCFLVALHYRASQDCRALAQAELDDGVDFEQEGKFCTSRISREVANGAAFLVREGSAWFVRGIKSSNWGNINGSYGFEDLSDAVALKWLQEHLTESNKPTRDAMLNRPQKPADTSFALYFQD